MNVQYFYFDHLVSKIVWPYLIPLLNFWNCLTCVCGMPELSDHIWYIMAMKIRLMCSTWPLVVLFHPSAYLKKMGLLSKITRLRSVKERLFVRYCYLHISSLVGIFFPSCHSFTWCFCWVWPSIFLGLVFASNRSFISLWPCIPENGYLIVDSTLHQLIVDWINGFD